MTTAPFLTPRIVGQAENAHRPVLDRVLSATGTPMTQWVALVMTAEAAEALDRDKLAGRIAAALKVDDTMARGGPGQPHGARAGRDR